MKEIFRFANATYKSEKDCSRRKAEIQNDGELLYIKN